MFRYVILFTKRIYNFTRQGQAKKLAQSPLLNRPGN